MRHGTLLLAATTLVTAAARAQDTAPRRGVRVGDRARIRAVERDANGRRIDCEARVTAVLGDTIVIENASRWGPCPSRLYEPATLARAQFAFTNRGSRLAHTALGVLLGGAAGGGTGRLFAGNGCQSGVDDCDGALSIALITFAGVVVGGAFGGFIGAVAPAGPQWQALPSTSPVRVAGLALRPSIRVSVR